MFVSIHCNSSTDKSINGVETYYYNDFLVGNLKTSKFAAIMQNAVVARTGIRNNKVRNYAAYTVLANTKDMLSVLVEVAYMSNNNDWNYLITDSFKDKAANGIAQGIIMG